LPISSWSCARVKRKFGETKNQRQRCRPALALGDRAARGDSRPNLEVELLGPPENHYLRRYAHLLLGEHLLQIVDSPDGLAVEADDDVAQPHAGSLGGPARLNREYQNSAPHGKLMKTRHPARHLAGLPADPDVAPRDLAVADEAGRHELRGV